MFLHLGQVKSFLYSFSGLNLVFLIISRLCSFILALFNGVAKNQNIFTEIK
jgi:hypothetical protein